MLESLLIQNWPWRIIRKKRELTSEIKTYLNSIYDRMAYFNTKNINDKPLTNTYVELLNNNINMLKENYWNMNKYETALKEFTDSKTINYNLTDINSIRASDRFIIIENKNPSKKKKEFKKLIIKQNSPKIDYSSRGDIATPVYN